MKLTYRGNPYTVSTPIEPCADSKDQLHNKLIYRGSTYDYNPRPMAIPKVVATDGPTVTLIYRGMTYKRKLQPSKPCQERPVINWRWNWA